MAKAVILCYHKVGSAQLEARRLNIEPERLRSHVRFFVRRAWPALVAREYAGTWPKRSVCFTFDDAYTSALENAVPVLESFSLRGVFYAVPGLVGTTSQWDGDLARPLASWEALRLARDAGHEIGNHTMTHPHLDRMSPEGQHREIVEADRRLRDEGLKPESFCYPYGGPCAQEIVPYRVGMALGKRPARDTDDRKRLPRIVVAYSDALPMLMYKVFVKPLLRRSGPS